MVLFESEYLRQTVGPTLAGGCAATAAARPADPVEHLANWLLRYVSNLESEEQLVKEASARCQLKATQEAERSARQAEKDAATRERDAAIAGLTDCTDDVWSLWQQCIDLATKYLPLGAAYAAAVADADAGDPSVFLRKAPPAEAAPTETGEPAAAEADGEGEEGDAEKAEAAAAAAAAVSNVTPRQDYSKQQLEHIASSKNQAWIAASAMKITRPFMAAPAEGDDEEAASAAAAAAAASLAPTLRMLDDNKSSLHIPNVLYEPATVFLKKFPKLGAYAAFGIPNAEGRLQALLCADTLIPAGSGRPLTDDDREVLQSIAAAASQAVQTMYAQRAEAAAEPAGLPLVQSLRLQLQDLQPSMAAPAAPAAAADADEDAPEEAAAPAAAAAGQTLEPLTAAKAAAEDNLRKAKDGLMAVRQALSDTADAAVKGLQTVMLAPKATYIACLAALLVMRQALKTICPWHRCRLLMTKELMQQLGALDTSDAWEPSTWEAAEPFLKAASTAAAQELMPQECPESCLGSLLTLLLQQLQIVHACADAVRAAETARAARQRSDKEAEAKAAAEAAAAAAAAKAAEEAAALEAAQAQEGEEQPAEDAEEA